MHAVPPSYPLNHALQELLNAASALVGLPAVPALRITARDLAVARTAADLQHLLDQVVHRRDHLLALRACLGSREPGRDLPVALVAVLVPTVDGCAEAVECLAAHLRVRIDQQLETWWGGAA